MYGSLRKTNAEKGSQKVHSNTTLDQFFSEKFRPAAKMAPGRHPKVDQKSMKKHPFSKICVFTILGTHFSVPKGSGGTPFAAKTQKFEKNIKTHTPTNILNESLGKKLALAPP